MAIIQDMQSGKMFPALSPQITEKTSELSLTQLSQLKKLGLKCLRLKKVNGQKPTYYWETDGVWLTELLTASTGECPSAENVSTLSQILMENAPEKYYLSPTACQGILHRASVHGKELPGMLKHALEQQAYMIIMPKTVDTITNL